MAEKLTDAAVPVSLTFTLSLVGLVVAAVSFVAGVSTASIFSEFLLTVVAGAAVAVGFTYALVAVFDRARPAMVVSALLAAAAGASLGGLGGILAGLIVGALFARLVFWIHYRQYRNPLKVSSQHIVHRLQ